MIDPGINNPLTLEFNYFKTEEPYDVLKIFDGETNILLSEISGEYETPPPPVTSPSGKFALGFNTNSSNRDDGWEVFYNTNNTGLTENSKAEIIDLFPNPANEKMYVSTNFHQAGEMSVVLYSNLGKQIFAKKIQVYPNKISSFVISDVNEGIYTALIEFKGIRISQKIIIF